MAKIKKGNKIKLKVSRNTFLSEHSIYFIKHNKVCLINFASEKLTMKNVSNIMIVIHFNRNIYY